MPQPPENEPSAVDRRQWIGYPPDGTVNDPDVTIESTHSEPAHDGAEEPLAYPLPREGDIISLDGGRNWAAVSNDGLVEALVHPGALGTYQGDAGDGWHEVTVAAFLRTLVPPEAMRPANGGEPR